MQNWIIFLHLKFVKSCPQCQVDHSHTTPPFGLKCKIYNHWQVYCIFISSSLLFLQKRQMSHNADKTMDWNHFWRIFAVSICAWFLKCQFGSLLQNWKKNRFRIKLDFFFEFELDFYCLCSLQKSISKSNCFFDFLHLIF